MRSQIISLSKVTVAFCVSVVGRNALVAIDRRVRSGGSQMARTENADGLIELATALRESSALPAPSATRSRMADTPSISSAMLGRQPMLAITPSTCMRIALGRLGIQIFKRNRPRRRVFGQTLWSRCHQHQLFLGQWRQVNFLGGLRVVEHDHIKPSIDQPVLQHGGQGLADRDRGVGHLLPESSRQRHREHPRQAGWQADGHAACQRTAYPSELFPCPLHLMQDAAAVRQQQLTRRSSTSSWRT
jgi:hypothetical protein